MFDKSGLILANSDNAIIEINKILAVFKKKKIQVKARKKILNVISINDCFKKNNQ